MSNVLSRIGRSVAVTVTAVALIASAGATFVARPQAAYAAGCDQVNIVHCGLEGNTLGANINSFQSLYNGGSDNGHNDLKAIYRWAGATDADVSNMSANNTKIGTVYKNGDVKVGGEVVATDAWVTARFNSGDGFVQVKDGVWARKTTTSFAQASEQMLVHFDKNGQMDWGVIIECGNAVKATPKPPKKNPALVCVSLTKAPTADKHTWILTAQAKATDTTIKSYEFNFGDGKTQTVPTSDSKTSLSHTYAGDSKTFKTTVSVNSTDIKNKTSADCAVEIKTPAAPVTPEAALVCKSLVAEAVLDKKLTYKFTATAVATNTKVTEYAFNFGDGKTETVKSAELTRATTHTYADAGKTYTATVAVSSADKKNVTAETCKVVIKTSVDNPEIVLVSSETPAAPEELINAGPAGAIGLFAGTSALGALGHQVVLRRRSRRE